jgi:hypothetical protein
VRLALDLSCYKPIIAVEFSGFWLLMETFGLIAVALV